MTGFDNHDDLRDLAVLYTLGALETDREHCEELERIEVHLRECEVCREEVAMASVGTAMLAQSAAETPPAALKARVVAAAGAARAPRAPTSPRFATWGAIAAAIVALVAFAMLLRSHPSEGPVAIELHGTATQAAGVVRAQGDAMTVQVEHLVQLPPGRVYQLWSIAPGAKPVPGPTFTVDSDGRATVGMHAPPERGLVIAVTVEPQGGSAAPTTTPFLSGKLE